MLFNGIANTCLFELLIRCDHGNSRVHKVPLKRPVEGKYGKKADPKRDGALF